jgi:anaphase-promoting complex subunit 4
MLTLGIGEYLAVAWSDGVVRVLGLEGGKPVHHLRVSDGGEGGKIEFLAWSRNFTEESRRRRKSGSRGGQERQMMLEGEKSGDLTADLPRELAFLEVETALPKLPPLPASGTSG